MPISAILPIVNTALSAIGVGGNLLSSRYQSQQSYKMMQATNAANAAEAEKAFQRSKEMWNLQNQYNSPEAQMARLKAAGLNPNLVYGNGAVANNTGSAPKYERASYDMHYQPASIGGLTALSGMLSQYQDFQMKQAQIDNVEAATRNTEQRTQNEGIREGLLALQGRAGEFELGRKSSLAPYQLEVQKGQARKIDSQVDQEVSKALRMRRQDLNEMLKGRLLEQAHDRGALDIQAKQKNLTTIDLQQEKMAAEILYKQYQNEWRAMGVTDSDHPILRMLTRAIQSGGIQMGPNADQLRDDFTPTPRRSTFPGAVLKKR